MSVDPKSITSALLELRAAILRSPNNPKPVMRKYNMLFLGEKFNNIGSRELYHALNDYFNISITLGELHRVLPSLCQSLSMHCEPMKSLNDLNNPVPAEFFITLF